MKGSACKCGKTVALPRDICPKCGGPMEQVELAPDATMLTHTTVHVVPDGFEGPIHLVLVELERGAKLLCQCEDESDLSIGRKGRVAAENGKFYFMGD